MKRVLIVVGLIIVLIFFGGFSLTGKVTQTPLVISGIPSNQIVEGFAKGSSYNTDHPYKITSDLHVFLNNQQGVKSSDNFADKKISVNKPVQIFAAYDSRNSLPSGWINTGATVTVSDSSASGTGKLLFISKSFNGGKLDLPYDILTNGFLIIIPQSGYAGLEYKCKDGTSFNNDDTGTCYTINHINSVLRHNCNGEVEFSTLKTPCEIEGEIKSEFCEEDDSGKDVYTKGLATIGTFYEYDNCNGNVLTEYFCIGNYITGRLLDWEEIECGGGCENGVCKKDWKIGRDFNVYTKKYFSWKYADESGEVHEENFGDLCLKDSASCVGDCKYSNVLLELNVTAEFVPVSVVEFDCGWMGCKNGACLK